MDTQAAILIFTGALVKPILMLLLVWLLGFLVRKQSAAFQHFILALGILGILVMSVLGILLPGIDWHGVPVIGALATIMDEYFLWFAQEFLQGISRQQWMILIGIYWAVAFSILYYHLLGLIGLHLQTRHSQAVSDAELLELCDQLCEVLDIQNRVTIKTSAQVASPFMWGFFRPVILLPREAVLWDKDKKLSVLMHELGHVSRRDWIVTQLVNITCAIFWFLPPLWWMASKMYDHAEMACDDLIYRLRDKHLAYAQSLLQLAGGENEMETHAGLGMQGHSAIYWRIAAVLDKRRPRNPVAIEAAQYWFITGFLLLIFLASIQIIPLQPVMPKVITWINTPLVVSPEVDEPIKGEDDLPDILKRFPTPMPIYKQKNDIEKVSIRAKPSVKEIIDTEKVKYETPVMQPNISVQGYLPVDIVIPEYPETALARGIEGRVVVEFIINTDGNIIEPKIISRSSPSKVFDKAVLSALKKSRYRPQMFDGQAVALHGVTEEFIFKLEPAQRRR